MTHDFETMAEVDLHPHQEGTIARDAMWAPVEAKGEAAEPGSTRDLRERSVQRDFAHFVEAWRWVVRDWWDDQGRAP